MSRIKSQAANKALPESGVNLISSEYERIVDRWFDLVTEHQRQFVETRPLVKIEASVNKRSKKAHENSISISV